MARGRNTRTISARVTDSEYLRLEKRAIKMGLNLNDYIKWSLLRSHTKRRLVL